MPELILMKEEKWKKGGQRPFENQKLEDNF